jgi:hypothetical protein
MIHLNERIKGEFYIAPTYNHLIRDGFLVGAYKLNAFQHFSVGTPKDLRRYKEYHGQI